MTDLKFELKTPPLNLMFCIASNQIILLDNHMKKQGTISYDEMKSIYMQTHKNPNHKINSKLSIFLFEEHKEFRTKELKFITNDRALLVKNILCFYSVYYLDSRNEIRNLQCDILIKKDGKDENESKGLPASQLYKYFVQNSYSFFLPHKIKKNIDNITFIITTNTKKEFQLEIKVGEIEKISLFEVIKDMRDISTYAYDHVYHNLIKNSKPFVEGIKIMKSCVHLKKYNFGDDKSQWEGWTIKARKSNFLKQSVKNYAFIFLRRKYLFPYYDTYRNFTLTLQEESKEKDYDFSNESLETIELASNSLATTFSVPPDFKEILESKINSLLLDEEILTYYLNNLKINEVEIIRVGYVVVYYIFQLILKNFDNNEKADAETKIKEWIIIIKNSWSRISVISEDEYSSRKLDDLYNLFY